MVQISINGLKFNYARERELFNGLLKINGVSKTKRSFVKSLDFHTRMSMPGDLPPKKKRLNFLHGYFII